MATSCCASRKPNSVMLVFVSPQLPDCPSFSKDGDQAHDVTYEPHQIRENDRARLVSAKERILECRVSLMCYVQNLSELGFAVYIIQQWVFVNIGIAEETGFNAHSQHM